jgi:hypothetical protein
MARKFMMADGRRIEQATLAGLGTLAPTMPVTNLQTMAPVEAARWTSLAGMGVEADLGGAVAVTLVALLYHNGTAAGTWRIRAAATQGDLTANPGYDTGSLSLWTAAGKPSPAALRLPSLHLPAAAQSFRWWRLDLADAANPDGFLEAGRLYIADAPTFGRNYDVGASWYHVDESEHVTARGGQVTVEELQRRRGLRVRLGRMSEDEAFGTVYELERVRGRARDVLALPRPDATTHLHRQSIYGLMKRLGGLRLDAPVGLYSTTIEIEELIP